MKILIVTDAWRQINGVVTTLENLNRTLIDMGYDVDFLNYETFRKSPSPNNAPYNTVISFFCIDFLKFCTGGIHKV